MFADSFGTSRLEDTVRMDLNTIKGGSLHEREALAEIPIQIRVDNILDERRLFDNFYDRFSHEFSRMVSSAAKGCFL